MGWFGKEKAEAITKDVDLMKRKENPKKELAIDDLTKEIIRQDLEYIRNFHTKVVTAINTSISQNEKSGHHLIETHRILKNIENQNARILDSLDILVKEKKRSDNDTELQLEILINAVRNIQNQTLTNSSKQNGDINNPASTRYSTDEEYSSDDYPDENYDDNPNKDDDENFPTGSIKANNDSSEQILLNANVGDSTTLTESANSYEGFHSEIRKLVEENFAEDEIPEEKPAFDLWGIRCRGVWCIAVPPKDDGTYDSSILQDSSFKTIKSAMGRNNSDTVVAVYDGKIHPRRLSGAEKVAQDYKINLVKLDDLNKFLALTESNKKNISDGD